RAKEQSGAAFHHERRGPRRPKNLGLLPTGTGLCNMPPMTAPPVWKRGFVSLSAVLVVVVMAAGVARAEVVFRKKAPPADSSATESSPSGGEIGTEGAPAGEGAAPSGPPSLQAE